MIDKVLAIYKKFPDPENRVYKQALKMKGELAAK
jgi:hypothetical protein